MKSARYALIAFALAIPVLAGAATTGQRNVLSNKKRCPHQHADGRRQQVWLL